MDVLFGEFFGLLIEGPTGHVDGIALMDGDDDIAVEGPAVFSIVFARASWGVGVAVVEAEDEATVGALLFGFEEGLGGYEEAMELLAGFEFVGDGGEFIDDAAAGDFAAEDDAAAFVWVGGDAFLFDLTALV